MDKNSIRAEYKKKRDNQSLIDKNRKDMIIADKLFVTREIIESNDIFIYISFSSEVDTLFIIKKLIEMGKNIYVPKIIDKKMYAVKYNFPLKKNKFGILEPISSEFSKKIDLTITPLLAFDEHMNRLGYGGGFYDRFFAENDCIKMGIAFDIQKSENLPYEKTDICLDCIITDEKIYRKENLNEII